MKARDLVRYLDKLELVIKATRDIQSITEVDQNHSNCILWTLSRRFRPNLPILAIFWPIMKVPMSSDVRKSTEINRKATRDIE